MTMIAQDEIAALEKLEAHIRKGLGENIADAVITHGELTITVAPEAIRDTVAWLRDDEGCLFKCFIDICGVDYPAREKRFDVVYHFLSLRLNQRIRIKVMVDAQTPVPSIIDLFPAANWFERETYDLYGVIFTDHPDLRRLLTDYGFEGHPLRKDFPLTGFVEVRYDDIEGRVVYEPVKLTQEFRNFDFLSPWEGTDYVLPGDEKADQAGKG